MLKYYIYLLLLFPISSKAHVDFHELTKQAFELYPEKVEFVMPNVEIINDQNLQEWLCKKNPCNNFNVRGAYIDKTIYMNENIKDWNTYEQSLYIHEVIHFIQDLRGKVSHKNTCDENFTLEYEAYKLQRQYLRKMRSDLYFDIESMAMKSAGKTCKANYDKIKKIWKE